MAFAGEVANLIVALKLDDSGFSGKLNAVAGQLNRLDPALSRIGRGTGQVASGIGRIATVAAAAAAGGLAAVVTTAISFEDAFAGVRKTVDASEADLDELNETFRAMAREIPLSFEELARIGEQAGALGIATEAIDEFTRVAALIGVTTDVSSDQAATSLGVLSNVLHLTEADYDNFGAALVDLGNKGASTESQILALAERAGAGASLVGIAADETLGWAASLANLGIEVEAGGTSLQKFFVESLQLIQDDDTLAVLAETAGTTADAFKQAFEEDASGALESFIIGLGKLDDSAKLAVLETLGFTDIRITRALLGLAGDTDNLTESLRIAGEAWEENTALTEEAEKRFRTTRSQLTLLGNNIRDAAATIGTELLPVITDLTREFVDFLNEPGTQRNLRDFAADLASGIRSLVGELRGTDFSGLISGIKLAADVSKAAFDAFRNLPPEIQSLAVAALAVNKVTGGAVGQIAAGLINILRGLVIGTAHISAGVVNVAGGVGGAGAAGAGAAGAAGGGIAALLRGAFVVTAFTAIAVAIGDFLAQNVTRPANPQQFDYLGAAAASGNFPSGSQLGVPAALTFAENLADELDMPLKFVQQSIVDAINIRGQTFDQAVADLRDGTTHQTHELTEEAGRTRREIGAGFTRTRTATVEAAAAEQTGRAITNTRLSLIEGVDRSNSGLLMDIKNKPTDGPASLGLLTSILAALGPGKEPKPPFEKGSVPSSQTTVADAFQSEQFLANLEEATTLPDTAMSALTTTATQVSQLPPILTAQERGLINAQVGLQNLQSTVREGSSRNAASQSVAASRLQQIAAVTSQVREGTGRVASLAASQLSLSSTANAQLGVIAAKRNTFTLYSTVNISASGSLSNLNTYTQLREG